MSHTPDRGIRPESQGTPLSANVEDRMVYVGSITSYQTSNPADTVVAYDCPQRYDSAAW